MLNNLVNLMNPNDQAGPPGGYVDCTYTTYEYHCDPGCNGAKVFVAEQYDTYTGDFCQATYSCGC